MLKEKLSLVPHKPGCYIMKNKNGVIIYVGKAKDLKNRLSSYFNGKQTGKTKMLVDDIEIFDYIVVDSELEALVLEINLIKKHNPKYNIMYTDDKSYPFIELTNEEIPRLLVVRNINKKKKGRLFGPYPNAYAAKKVVTLLNRIYPLKKCQTMGKKTCLYYHLGECLGYCINKVDKEKIEEMVNEIIRFLKGNYDRVIKKLEDKMEVASNGLNYEQALEYKELLDYINITLKRQQVEINDQVDRDIFGYYFDKGYVCIETLYIRGGKLLGEHKQIFPLIDTLEEELVGYISRFYEKNNIKPKEILVPSIVDGTILEDILQIKVSTPLKGSKRKLLEMANDNAKINLMENFELIKRDESRTVEAMEELSNILKIENIRRIEAFDNSNLFGNYSVSGMVVFVDGIPSKNDYRKYKISNLTLNDDYNIMKEVIYRRYFRVLKENQEKPDIIIVDGGKIQIGAAREVLDSLGFNIPVFGLKKNDKHKTSELLGGYPIDIIPIKKNSNVFHLLNRIQDEVHRFTITYHKDIRSKGSLTSLLDLVEGIGDKRRKELIKKFGSLKKIKEASIEELKNILPDSVAANLYKFLKDYQE